MATCKEACQGEILLSFALEEAFMKPDRTLLQTALLRGKLAAQNVGTGTHAPTERSCSGQSAFGQYLHAR